MNKLYKIITYLFSPVDRRIKLYIKFMLYCKKKDYPRLGEIISRRLQVRHGVFLSYSATFDHSLTFYHPVGIIIGNGCTIGKNVSIFQNVTIGRSDKLVDAYPKVGDNSIIYAGAVLIGDIEIGRNCIVGANAVVTKSMPDNSLAIGVPAKIIQRNKSEGR